MAWSDRAVSSSCRSKFPSLRQEHSVHQLLYQPHLTLLYDVDAMGEFEKVDLLASTFNIDSMKHLYMAQMEINSILFARSLIFATYKGF